MNKVMNKVTRAGVTRYLVIGDLELFHNMARAELLNALPSDMDRETHREMQDRLDELNKMTTYVDIKKFIKIHYRKDVDLKSLDRIIDILNRTDVMTFKYSNIAYCESQSEQINAISHEIKSRFLSSNEPWRFVGWGQYNAHVYNVTNIPFGDKYAETSERSHQPNRDVKNYGRKAGNLLNPY